MTRRFTVMGFTEAELGFVLAAVFAVLSVASLSTQQSTESLAAKQDTLARKYDSVSTAFAAYRDSVRKRSNQGLASGIVCTRSASAPSGAAC